MDDNLTAFGPSEVAHALPSVTWELLNCGLSVAAGISLLICLRYLFAMYVNERKRWQMPWWNAITHLSTYRLAVGFTVFLAGEWPRATWVWWARYATNHHIGSVDWMGQWPWIVLPVGFGVLCIMGKACIIRALIPMVWGRYAYALICGSAVGVMIASELIN